jgi:tRNA (guanine26-N2/guanine27-N2)-dimethyltransferase
MFSPWKQDCVECGSKLNTAGPLWLGKIFDKEFCALMEKEVVGLNLGQEKKIHKLLSLAQIEAEAPVTYYAMDKVCDKMNLRIPPLIKTIDELRTAGFQATPTHFNSRGIRTDAPSSVLKAHIRRLVQT